jgi:hypothetical protein
VRSEGVRRRRWLGREFGTKILRITAAGGVPRSTRVISTPLEAITTPSGSKGTDSGTWARKVSRAQNRWLKPAKTIAPAIAKRATVRARVVGGGGGNGARLIGRPYGLADRRSRLAKVTESSRLPKSERGFPQPTGSPLSATLAIWSVLRRMSPREV